MSLKDKVKNIKSLANTSGIEFKKPSVSVMEKYCSALKESTKASDYLKGRNINEESIEYFNLGYDKGRNAISIPVYKNDELVNIKYRLLEPDKYKYTQEKDCEVWLFHEKGIEHGEEKDGLLIVEGEFDLISCWQAGIKNVVSPASGKDSYRPWLEFIDKIGNVWIAYDNDEPGIEAAQTLSEHVGINKTKHVIYPEGYKDANDFFMEHNKEDFKELIKEADYFHSHQFETIGDVINNFRSSSGLGEKLRIMPGVQLTDDHMIIVSGKTNAGKTTYVLNLARELVDEDKPTLILPFERGINNVGKRFIGIDMNYTEEELMDLDSDDWDDYISKIREKPLYFSVPAKDEILDTIERAKRLYGIEVVIIDHLDYIAGQSSDKYTFQSTLMHDLKEFAIDKAVAFVVVHHPNKPNKFNKDNRLTNDDLGGSSSISQVAETVFMIESDVDSGFITPYATKNKGDMTEDTFHFNVKTGRIGDSYVGDEFDNIKSNENDW